MKVGHLLVAGSALGQLAFWDVRNPGQLLSAFYKTQSEDIISVSAQNDSMILSGSEDQSIAVFNLGGQNEQDALEMIVNPDQSARRLLPIDGAHFGYECSDNSVGIYNLDSGMRVRQFAFPNSVG